MFVQELREMTQSTISKETALPECKPNKKFKRGTTAEGESKTQVFLGGSCNPTTWRKEQAIPVLKNAGVVYYNPQVERWHPDLLVIEEKAKTSCDILFFVLDNITRGIASMVEVAYLAGCGREMVTVMVDYDRTPAIGGKDLSVEEVDALNRGRDFLCSILRFEQIPVFNDVSDALRELTKMARSDKVMSQLAQSNYVSVPIFRGIRLSDAIIGASHVYRKVSGADGKVTVTTATAALRDYFEGVEHVGEIQEADVQASLQASSRESGLLTAFDQDSFLCTIADFKMRAYNVANTLAAAQLATKKTRKDDVIFTHHGSSRIDIFLGGCCFKNSKGYDGTSDWRQDFAIPNLKKLKVSYYNPDRADWTSALIAAERKCKRNSKVLLMVIGSNTRGIGSMVEASHLIGEGATNLVIVLQNVVVNSMIEGEKVDEDEAKDLNRGRAYLEDAAINNRVSVCSSIQEGLSVALAAIGVHAESTILSKNIAENSSMAGQERAPSSTRWAKRAEAQSRLRLQSQGDQGSKLTRRTMSAGVVSRSEGKAQLPPLEPELHPFKASGK